MYELAILRERPLPKMNGREGAMFTIYCDFAVPFA
jgi:hypothetical protein